MTPILSLPEIRSGDPLAPLILDAMSVSGIVLADGDVIALAQKVVSKSEGRFVSLSTVTPSQAAVDLAAKAGKDPRVVELILQESTQIVRWAPGVIIAAHRLGFVMANAGIDASNIGTERDDDQVLLLPQDPDRSAQRLHQQIFAATGARIGVLIVDSFGRAWRLGTVGTAIGLAGLPGLIDLRGRPDRAGRVLQSTDLAAADELAAAASLMMGQSDEGRPAVHIRGFPYPMREGSAAELIRPKTSDLFR